jgi:predicted TIM-barrel fold metal-dependent hydrolase
MIVDCHVHVSAFTRAHGFMSQRLYNSIPFRFMRWRLGIDGDDSETERQLVGSLLRTVEETEILDAAVVLAFDAVFDDRGWLDQANTHLYVTNDYVIGLAERYPNILFGASVHPYRKDAVEELERCIKAGAVLLKWLPITQNFNPSDPRCFPMYEMLAHYKLPLLSHTGDEKALPNLNVAMADPYLLVPALERGVTVIAAHCGTGMTSQGTEFVSEFVRLARHYEHCYGDTSGINNPTRWYTWGRLLNSPEVRRKLVHGSDWPIPAFPPPAELPASSWYHFMRERNWMRRDVLIKLALGLEADYWHRGATLLRLPSKAGAAPASLAPPATAPPQMVAAGLG